MIEPLLVLRFGAACLVIGLVLFALQTATRRLHRVRARGGPGGSLVAVLETTPLPGNASLHAVRIGSGYYCIGRTATHVTTICAIAGDDVARSLVPESQAGPRPLATVFTRLRTSLARVVPRA